VEASPFNCVVAESGLVPCLALRQRRFNGCYRSPKIWTRLADLGGDFELNAQLGVILTPILLRACDTVPKDRAGSGGYSEIRSRALCGS
jgi:hypothetical protein